MINALELFAYDAWPSRNDRPWGPDCERGTSEWDLIDFHVDLGCGTRPKARIGIDRFPAPGVDILADLDPIRVYALPPEPGKPGWEIHDGKLLCHHSGAESLLGTFGRNASPYEYWGYPDCQLLDVTRGRLPFADSSIESVVSHHFFEHVGEGLIPLVDEVYRVLKPGGIFRAITPLFPSTSAVEDPDHCRYFMGHDGGGGTWDAFCGKPGIPHWTESFSVPYTRARFTKVHQDLTARVTPDLWWSPADVREIRVALRAEK